MKSRKDDKKLDPFALDFDLCDFSLDGLTGNAIDVAQDEIDPLADVEYSGDEEADAKAEYSALLKAFINRRKREAERFRLATDSEYWCAICFETREQKEAFLAALDLLRHGDKYLDGYRVAEKFGIALPPADVPYNTSEKVDKKLAALVLSAP